MATYKRFNDNDELSQGNAETNINLSDILPMQHTAGDNNDKKISIKNLMTIPVCRAGAWTNGTAEATCLNYPSFSPALGQCISVTFSELFSDTTYAPQLKLGSNLLPIKVHGVVAGVNFCKAEMSFEGIVKTTATEAGTATGQSQDSATWYLDLDSNIKTADYTEGSESVTLSDGTAISPGGGGGGDEYMKAWIGTQEEYDAIENPDEQTIYFISEE